MIATGDADKPAGHRRLGFVVDEEGTLTVELDAVCQEPAHLRLEPDERNVAFRIAVPRKPPLQECPHAAPSPRVRLSESNRAFWFWSWS